MARGYVVAGAGVEREAMRTDFDADEARKRRLEERDAETEIPADWEGDR